MYPHDNISRQRPPLVCRDRFLDSIQFREILRPDIAGLAITRVG